MPKRSSFRAGEPCWVDVPTPDLEGSIAFYSALLGWDVQRGEAEIGHYSIATLREKQVCGLTPAQEGQAPLWACYISVPDIELTTRRVADNGGAIRRAPADVMHLGRTADLVDRTGGVLSLWQPGAMAGAEVVLEEGTLAWVELSTRDLAGATAFYRSVFGWGVLNEGGYTHFQLGDDSVAGAMDMPSTVPPSVSAFWIPYFAAADPASVATRAGELGGHLLVPFMEMGSVAFSVVMDPFGAMFGLLRQRSAA